MLPQVESGTFPNPEGVPPPVHATRTALLYSISQSLANVIVHLVFSTKDRQPSLRDTMLREAVWAYLGEISSRLGCPTLITGGTEDHVHLLARLSRSLDMAEWVKELKRASALWRRRQEASLHEFRWQAGYGIFSVSQSNVPRVIRYIRDQEEHHARRDFQEEFRAILKRHGLEWDERYVWN